jgi:hypothetical protein
MVGPARAEACLSSLQRMIYPREAAPYRAAASETGGSRESPAASDQSSPLIQTVREELMQGTLNATISWKSAAAADRVNLRTSAGWINY